MSIYGYDTIQSLNEQLGDLRQICGIERFTVVGGRGAGNEVLHIRNGSGLRLDIHVSRGFDIGLCELFSIPVSWVSPTGHVSPFAFEPQGTEWNRGFEGGLLATCGLQQAGQPNTDGSEPLGQHGRVSYLPSEILCAEITRESQPHIVLRAKLCETKACGDKLVLYRTIRIPIFENTIELCDEVVNEGFTDAPHLMLYHVNFGFPLISPSARIGHFKSKRELIKGQTNLANCLSVFPVGNIKPDVVLHTDIEADGKHMSLHIANEIDFNKKKYDLQVLFVYDKKQCPYLTQWRCQRRAVNVFAFEPGNVSTKGRAFHRQEGTLTVLKPGESRTYNLKLSFKLEGK